MNPNAKRLRVAICGGGIGGLTCALVLSKYPDIQVDVYEAAAHFSEVGAGVGVWPRPWKVLESLGLAPDLLQLTEIRPPTGPVPILNWRRSDQPKGLPFYTLRADGVLLTFSRPDFQQCLLRNLTCRVHCSKRLKTFQQHDFPISGSPPGRVELTFEDGTTATCDVLIGADGIRSSVRRAMLTQHAAKLHARHNANAAEERTRVMDQELMTLLAAVEPVWSGSVAYRSVIPAAKLRRVNPGHSVFKSTTQYLGKNAHIIAYTISKGSMINVAAFVCRHDLEGTAYGGPWVTEADGAEVMAVFEGWETDVRLLIGCIDKATKWAVHTVRPLPSFVSGNVALIGDAAHAEQPTQGTGAGQAIEDAYFLATLLGNTLTRTQTVTRALSIYDAVRRPFASDVAERCRFNALCFTLCHPTVVADLAPIHDGFESEGGQCLFVGHQEEEPQHEGEGKGCLHDTERAVMMALVKMGERVKKNWKWVWETSVEASVEEAVRMLER